MSDFMKAVGNIPTGCFILTYEYSDKHYGTLVSWVQQASFAPPILTVCVKKGRYQIEHICNCKKFSLNLISKNSKHLIGHFVNGFSKYDDPFVDLKVKIGNNGAIFLPECKSVLECELLSSLHAEGDHVILASKVVDGFVIAPDDDVYVHIRKTGEHY